MISERKLQKIETMNRLLKILNDRVFADSPLKSDGSGYWADSESYRICLTSDGYDFMYKEYSICEIEESNLDLETIENIVKDKFIELCIYIEDTLSKRLNLIQGLNKRLNSLQGNLYD